jgi:hypothetical protein
VLRELKQQEEKLAGQLEKVQRDVFRDEKEQQQLGKTHQKLLEDQAKVSAHLQDMQGDPSATLTEPQSARLQATRDGTGFDDDRSIDDTRGSPTPAPTPATPRTATTLTAPTRTNSRSSR